MLLYHFTSPAPVPQILKTGLNRGSVALSAAQSLKTVWLTTDPTPGGHGLEMGGAMMTDDDRQQAFEWSGVRPPRGTRFPKDGSVRITVRASATDRNLHEYLPWARRHIAPDWLAILHPAGANMRKARTWRLYFGVFPPEDLVAVDSGQPAAAEVPWSAAAPKPGPSAALEAPQPWNR